MKPLAWMQWACATVFVFGMTLSAMAADTDHGGDHGGEHGDGHAMVKHGDDAMESHVMESHAMDKHDDGLGDAMMKDGHEMGHDMAQDMAHDDHGDMMKHGDDAMHGDAMHGDDMHGDGMMKHHGDGTTVLATVGGIDITLGHVAAMTSTLTDDQRSMPAADVMAGLLERLIQQEAVAQQMIDVPDWVALQAENEYRSLLASTMINEIADSIHISDSDLQYAYDQRYAAFTAVTEYNASHILVATKDEAMDLITQLINGADFATTARENSTGPSGPNGGQLGWFGVGSMVPSFEAAVRNMEIGDISALPVQTQFGWHVIRLNDARDPGVPSLGEVTTELREEMWREKFNQRVAEVLAMTPIERADLSAIDASILFDGTLMEN